MSLITGKSPVLTHTTLFASINSKWTPENEARVQRCQAELRRLFHSTFANWATSSPEEKRKIIQVAAGKVFFDIDVKETRLYPVGLKALKLLGFGRDAISHAALDVVNRKLGVLHLIPQGPATSIKLPVAETLDELFHQESLSIKNKLFKSFCSEDKLDQALSLIAEGVDPNLCSGEDQNTLLHWAIIYDRDDIAQKLVNRGADINARNNRGETPLHLAINKKMEGAAKTLINRGANVDAVNNEGYSVLSEAIVRGLEDVAVMIVKKGAKLNVVNIHKERPLHLAIMWDRHEVVKAFIAAGADIELQEVEGNTPLNYAIIYGRVDIAKTLLEAGARVFTKNLEGDSPYYSVDTYGAIDLKDKMESLLEQYRRVVESRKALAQVFGVKGSFRFLEEVVHEYEAMSEIDAIKEQQVICHHFLDTVTEEGFDKSGFFSSAAVSNKIRATLDSLTDTHTVGKKTAEKLIEELKEGQDLFLLEGWEEHAISIFIHKDVNGELYLAKCNRGHERDLFAINIYKIGVDIDSAELKSAIDAFRFVAEDSSKKTTEVRINMEWKRINWVKTGINDELKLGEPVKTLDLKHQKAGNCSWASTKAGFFAQLYWLAKEHPSESISANPEKYAREAYKLYSSFSRRAAIEKYIEKTPTEELDNYLITHCKGKIVNKLYSEWSSEQQEFNFRKALEAVEAYEKNIRRVNHEFYTKHRI